MFGKSMLLTLVAKSLAENPNLHVIQASNWDEVKAQTVERVPDVLIYDPEGETENAILRFLNDNPDMLLINLDTERNRALVIAGQERRALTLERVKEIVESGLPGEKP